MPRPRKGVTLSNIHHVDSYFHNALKSNRLSTSKSLESLNLIYDAKEAFLKLPVINWTNDTTKKESILKRKEELQTWIDKYISTEKWQRCLLTLRQNKSRKKLKLRRLDLKMDVYLTVKALAKKQGLSIGDTIYNLAKPKLDKMYKTEFANEFKLPKQK
jgi:hypothetical protein